MLILGIETSCDETAAAVVEDGQRVLSSVVASQIEEHRIYGGVVPEIASRRHSEAITAVVGGALNEAGAAISDISAVAVTYAPGLIGALLVGVNFAKGLALSAGLPLVPVHHLRGHIAANYITHPELRPPFLSLVVSGGHSHIVDVRDYCTLDVVARTRDDAAGEAFDKAARAMGIPYPGGVELDRIAEGGDPYRYALPRPRVEGSELDFSFSGLKTAALNLLNSAGQGGGDKRAQPLRQLPAGGGGVPCGPLRPGGPGERGEEYSGSRRRFRQPAAEKGARKTGPGDRHKAVSPGAQILRGQRRHDSGPGLL